MRCDSCHAIKKAGFTRKTAHTGAVTLMMCMDARMSRAHGAVAEDSYLTTAAVDEDPMPSPVGHSISYRIAVGPLLFEDLVFGGKILITHRKFLVHCPGDMGQNAYPIHNHPHDQLALIGRL